MNKEKTPIEPTEDKPMSEIEMAQQAVLYINQKDSLDDVTLIPVIYDGVKTYAVTIKDTEEDDTTRLTPIMLVLNEDMFDKLKPLINDKNIKQDGTDTK